MKTTDIPVRIDLPFAENAGTSYIRTIPDTTTDVGRASLDQGFPAECFEDKLPAGKDFNGILHRMSAWDRWCSAGAPTFYDSAFSTAIGGYPHGARLLSTDLSTVWVSTADDNTTDPDGGSPANWVSAEYLSNAGKVGQVTWAAYNAGDTATQLVCNGRSLLRATYPRLFTAIGANWGSVDGTHFTLPDLRSAFVQGVDTAGGLTKGASDPWGLFTYYLDQFQGHIHNMFGIGTGPNKKTITDDEAADYNQPSSGPVTDGSNGSPRFGLTTHPRGVGLVPLIYI